MSIIVLNKIAEERMNRAGGEIEAGSAEDLKDALTPPTGDGDAGAAAPPPAPSDTPETSAPAGPQSSAPPAAGMPGTAALVPTATLTAAAVDFPQPVAAQ